jgi:hypothetical protein
VGELLGGDVCGALSGSNEVDENVGGLAEMAPGAQMGLEGSTLSH